MLIYLPVAQETAQRNPAQASTRRSIKANSAARSRACARSGARARQIWQHLLRVCVCARIDRKRGRFCINVSASHEQWMDMVSATLQKRHRTTRRCSSLCCRTVRSYGKVTAGHNTTEFFVFALFILHIHVCGCVACDHTLNFSICK